MTTSQPDEITDHITRHLGAPLDLCLREIVGNLRIQVVPAAIDRPYQTLITTGMSEYAMTAPAGAHDYRHIELFMHLPDDWPLSPEALKDPNHYWPIEWMRLIAHYPESSPVFLVSEQTIGNSPPEPFAANTSLSCMMLLADPTDFGCLRRTDGRTVRFYQLFPLYEEERVLKERDGTRVLLERFERYGVSEVVQPDRINVGIARPSPGGAISAR